MEKGYKELKEEILKRIKEKLMQYNWPFISMIIATILI